VFIFVKESANISTLRSHVLDALSIVNFVWEKHGKGPKDEKVYPTITSGDDGKHMINSLHYKGLAIDLRTRDLEGGSLGSIAKGIHAELKGLLGRDYDVVLEKDHIHLEYDPKNV
jgi:hypothetical protein